MLFCGTLASPRRFSARFGRYGRHAQSEAAVTEMLAEANVTGMPFCGPRWHCPPIPPAHRPSWLVCCLAPIHSVCGFMLLLITNTSVMGLSAIITYAFAIGSQN